MANKKFITGLAILAMVLILGVGYAIVSSVDISFNGDVKVKDANIKVVIDSYVDKTEQANIEHNITNDSKTAEFTISDIKLEEEVVLTYTIASKESDISAYIEENSQITNSNPTFFDVTYEVVGNKILGPIGSGSETSAVELKVKLKKTPITEEDSTATISFTIKANPTN